jgi:HlyD family type I secretion membrane fusion protein
MNAAPSKSRSGELSLGYLDTAPPSWGTRGLAYLLLVLFAAAAVAAVVIQLPETVACPFVLVPCGGTDPVRASCDGFVSELRVHDGQEVKAGDPLVVIRSDITSDRSGELASLEVQQQGAAESLANARKKYDSQRLADEDGLHQLQARAAALARKITATHQVHVLEKEVHETTLARAEEDVKSRQQEVEYRRKARKVASHVADVGARLRESRAVSDLDQLRVQLEADRVAVDLYQAERELSDGKLQLKVLQVQRARQIAEEQLALDALAIEQQDNATAQAKLRHQMEVAAREFAEQERSLQEIMRKADIRTAALRRELERAHGNEVSVTAACAGVVLRLQVKGSGAFVRTGDVLCELAGVADRLEAELAIPPARIGRISSEQRVKLLYDAFPYQRYGIKHGTVRWVSPASVGGADGPAFRILVDPDESALFADGQDRPLRAGMGGQAQIVVGRRSLLHYAFEPLWQLKENMANPPPK